MLSASFAEELNSSRSTERVYRGVLAGAAVFVAVFLGFSIWYARHLDWNSMRLAPAAAALAGLPIYPGADAGVVTGHIYSPIGALAFAPIAWISDVSTMMSAGAAISAACFISPFAALGWCAVRWGRVRRLDAIAVILAALLLAAFDVRLRYALVMVHAEAPAVSLGAAAIIFAGAGRCDPRSWVWAGALSVFAGMSKQTLLPTWVGLGLISFFSGRFSFVRFAIGSGAAGAVLAVFIAVQESWQSFLYNCAWLPSRHPWNTATYTFAVGGLPTGQELVPKLRAIVDAFLQLTPAWWPGFVVAAWFLLFRHRPEARIENPMIDAAIYGAGCALLQLPLAFASFLKVGGDANAFAPLLMPLLVMGTAGALQVLSNDAARPSDLARSVLVAGLLVLMACNVPRMCFLVHATTTQADPNRPIVAYVRDHPGQVYLPWNPLHTWVAERTRYHFEYGVFDRALARAPISDRHYRQGLPAALEYVAVRKSQAPTGQNMFLRHLPDLIPAPSPHGLEDWTFFRLSARVTD